MGMIVAIGVGIPYRTECRRGNAEPVEETEWDIPASYRSFWVW